MDMNTLLHLIYEEDSLGTFVLVTLILGGGASYLSGRAIALTWRPWWQVVLAALVLGGVVRFFHLALFDGTLLSLHYYLVDTLFCLAFGFLGYRITRAGQMAEQYLWIYRRSGLLSWTAKNPAEGGSAAESG
jgi:hypothetical protein